MKRFFIFALVASVFAACSTDATQDLAPEIPTAPDELHVSFDAEDTRIQLGDNGSPVWTKDDLVSVFYRSNANQKWQFQGNTGDTEGTLKRIDAGTATQQTTQIVAVYPYNENYWFNWNTYNVEASLPAEQTYLANSYGIGSSLMVSSSEFNQLSFKNVCGWLKLQFTGRGYLSNIVLRGNNGEQVAGKIYVNTSDASCVLASEMGSTEDDGIGGTGGNLLFDDTILTEVTLNCGEAGVRLNAETPKAFYIALPPQTFAQGITITATCEDGTVMTKSTENAITIERNHILPMASLVVEKPDAPDAPAQPTPPANEIWYTSSDGNIVEPYFDDEFGGAILLSNTCEEGKGIMKFNGNVTEVGYYTFYNRKKLTSITIPDSVTSIGEKAFHYCSALRSITIPDSVTSIGKSAFQSCPALISITIPNSVTEIGEYTFYGCFALTSINIPNSVTSIGNYAFYDCQALKSITIPGSVTEIEEYTFYGCDALTSITIPDSVTEIGWGAFASCDAMTSFYGKFASEDNRCLIIDGVLNSFAPVGLTTYTIPNSVTSIGNAAFNGCSALTSITIPNSVTSIGRAAFCNCSKLTSITIPNSVTAIGSSAFEDCSALKKVYCKPTTPPTGGYFMFDNNVSGRRIYVPTASVDAYKAASCWENYADYIEPYEFTE